jgi:hypothetical protein
MVPGGGGFAPRIPTYHGLKEDEILRIQVFFAPAATAEQDPENALCNQQCCICLDPLGADMGLKRLPGCEHLYHALCIDPWLTTHNTCPYCRLEVKAPEEGRTSAIPSGALSSPAERQATIAGVHGGLHNQPKTSTTGNDSEPERNLQLSMMDIGDVELDSPKNADRVRKDSTHSQNPDGTPHNISISPPESPRGAHNYNNNQNGDEGRDSQMLEVATTPKAGDSAGHEKKKSQFDVNSLVADGFGHESKRGEKASNYNANRGGDNDLTNKMNEIEIEVSGDVGNDMAIDRSARQSRSDDNSSATHSPA